MSLLEGLLLYHNLGLLYFNLLAVLSELEALLLDQDRTHSCFQSREGYLAALPNSVVAHSWVIRSRDSQ